MLIKVKTGQIPWKPIILHLLAFWLRFYRFSQQVFTSFFAFFYFFISLLNYFPKQVGPTVLFFLSGIILSILIHYREFHTFMPFIDVIGRKSELCTEETAVKWSKLRQKRYDFSESQKVSWKFVYISISIWRFFLIRTSKYR